MVPLSEAPTQARDQGLEIQENFEYYLSFSATIKPDLKISKGYELENEIKLSLSGMRAM
ncbi:hypothetical protein GcM3_054025 [Golovinomyces cichoracearum]|uniref:Uncharacterized protein n=1 Tax=Golovinomyces cichoracearum TaxID=62708 RepID=A0A420IYI0_9PEZI|nr:hypothetical protein GcM3_054025 [Golovinomyces cichoracearum]